MEDFEMDFECDERFDFEDEIQPFEQIADLRHRVEFTQSFGE